jgi:hypothetical protein
MIVNIRILERFVRFRMEQYSLENVRYKGEDRMKLMEMKHTEKDSLLSRVQPERPKF